MLVKDSDRLMSFLYEIYNEHAVSEFIKLRGFHPSASTSRARRSNAATSDKGKQICDNSKDLIQCGRI